MAGMSMLLMWYIAYHTSLSTFFFTSSTLSCPFTFPPSPPPPLLPCHLSSALSGEIDNPFCAVDMMERLGKDPKTSDFLNDPEFRRKLEELSKDPDKLIK